MRSAADQRAVHEQLQYALDSRVLIEQAKGVLMERHALTAQAAFDQLRRYAREPWNGQWVEFARKGVPPVNGRGDVR